MCSYVHARVFIIDHGISHQNIIQTKVVKEIQREFKRQKKFEHNILEKYRTT